jgi:hypothetical protein
MAMSIWRRAAWRRPPRVEYRNATDASLPPSC